MCIGIHAAKIGIIIETSKEKRRKKNPHYDLGVDCG
jgi:hypothetical protein